MSETKAETKTENRPSWVDIFVERPVLSIVISLALVLIGVRAAMDLPIQEFPRIESASLVINTPYVGASAEVVQGFITEPIERIAATIPGVDYVDATSTAGMSTVTVWLELNQKSTDALAELSSRLSQIRFELPQGAEDPAVSVRRADRPIAGFYLDIPLKAGMTRAETSDYLTRRVNPILTAIPGVQNVTLEAGRMPAMRIWMDPDRLAMFQLSPRDVEEALQRNNIIATIGRSENTNQRIDLMVNTSLQTVEDFEQMVIREVEGAVIRVRDVARVELGEEEGSVNAMLDLQDAVYIGIWPLPGSNEIDIGDRLYVALDEINATLPDGMKIGIGYDVTTYMRNALREIIITLIETVILVGIVVVAFMGSLRTALVPLVAIPISLLGAVAAMSLMGFSLNLLTILAVVLSVGLVVDDAIVVVENVSRFMRQGMTRTQAALASSRQLLSPIIGMTITLAAVYAPIGLLSGLTGVLFKEFAFTLAVAVLISGVVAITLSPIMSAYVCPEGGHEGRFTQWVNNWFIRIQESYGRMLDKTLGSGPQVFAVGMYFTVLIIPLFLLSQQELAPTEDESSISVVTSAPPDASLEYTSKYMLDVISTMHSLPHTYAMWEIVQPGGAFGGMEFVDYSERDKSVHEIFPEAFQKLKQVTGVKAFPTLGSALPTAGNFPVELVIMSPDSAEDMLPYAEKIVAAAYKTGMFMFASTNLNIDLPQGRFQLDRERVANAGMSLQDVTKQMGLLLSGNYVNRFDLEGKAYRVVPMVEKGGRPDPQALLDMKIRTPDGDLIPLANLATLETKSAPRYLAKFQQKNAFRVYGGVLPNATKEQALSALEEAAKEILPAGYTIDYAGESRQIRQEGNTLIGVLGVALAFVFMVLAVQFNSFRDPLVVLLGSVPLAFSGAMLFTFVGWTTINIYSQVGFITLAGLIAKNAILIVEFANQLQIQGKDKLAAIKEASIIRLRPVLMTTGATVLGHFPLVLVSGPGAEARNSIGIVLVAGMLVGTIFTLFILPNVYMWLASEHKQPEASDSVGDTVTAS
ncbi:efflux RND transporter permease subunit [Oceanicoccus sagamiensis]|uniref:Multidrug efflux protein n=1 Tax=Oceanicoccus sagamiensis TaxID=716816 RepID=A0A1X9NDV1_9GAMM|nr:efflux RND transporter permease subunit [Oceanicoccus sagamiensis]ARN76210.1 multidrug efflux protein [Oceanicoccus sagamiensis]